MKTRSPHFLFFIFLMSVFLSCGFQKNPVASEEKVSQDGHPEHSRTETPSPVTFDKAKGLSILPETQVAIGLCTEEVSDLIQVPHRALVSTYTGDFVYTENEGRYLRQAVVKGARYPGGWEIADGLFAGDRVVVEPAWWLYLIELQAVRGGSHSH